MAHESIRTQTEEVSIEQGKPYQGARVEKSPDDLLSRISHEIFKRDCLDRKLKRHHVTGKYPLVVPKDCSHIRQASHSPVRLASDFFRLRER